MIDNKQVKAKKNMLEVQCIYIFCNFVNLVLKNIVYGKVYNNNNAYYRRTSY